MQKPPSEEDIKRMETLEEVIVEDEEDETLAEQSQPSDSREIHVHQYPELAVGEESYGFGTTTQCHTPSVLDFGIIGAAKEHEHEESILDDEPNDPPYDPPVVPPEPPIEPPVVPPVEPPEEPPVEPPPPRECAPKNVELNFDVIENDWGVHVHETKNEQANHPTNHPFNNEHSERDGGEELNILFGDVLIGYEGCIVEQFILDFGDTGGLHGPFVWESVYDGDDYIGMTRSYNESTTYVLPWDEVGFHFSDQLLAGDLDFNLRTGEFSYEPSDNAGDTITFQYVLGGGDTDACCNVYGTVNIDVLPLPPVDSIT